MKSISTSVHSTISDLVSDDEYAHKAMRAQKVKNMWASVVEPVFLDHTNAVYIIKKDGISTLTVYVDDSIFASELNARRELIKLKLQQQFNEVVDDFFIKISYGRMKQRYAFKRDDLDPFYTHKTPSIPLSLDKRKELEALVSMIPNEGIRQALLQAMIDDLEWKSGIEFEKGGNLPF